MLKEITNEFNEKHSALINEYRKKYEDVLVNILKEVGMYDIDVIDNDTKKKGRLKVYPESYNTIGSEIKFVPYKKNGEMSLQAQRLYYYTVEDEIINIIKNRFVKC